MEDAIAEALKFDLAQEYGIAVRYLILTNKMKEMKKPEVANILSELAADSVSHSDHIRKILKDGGIDPEDTFKFYKSDFKDIKLALKSSFFLESRMAKEYSEIASKIGRDHEHYETFVTLANWETVHMYQVLNAIKLVEGLETVEGAKEAREKLVERMKSISEEMSRFDAEEKKNLLAPEGGSGTDREFESTLTEALEKARKLGKDLYGMTKIKDEEEKLKEAGIPAKDVMEDDVVKVIFQERIYEGYCFRCSENHTIKDPQHVVMDGDRPAVKGTCPHCEAPMFTLDV
jgi:rubrerythrin